MQKSRQLAFISAIAAAAAAIPAWAQDDRSSPPLPELPRTLETSEQTIRVVAVAEGLSHPWSLAFLPNGDMLVTERPGRLRIVRDGELAAEPVAGVPDVHVTRLGGLLDVALHPDFETNRYVYLTHSKGRDDGLSTTALVRGRFDGDALTAVEELFVANNWSESVTNFGGRLAFDGEGHLFLAVGERQESERAQNGLDHGGKVLRLRDNGMVPDDNPFVGRDDFAPEVYSLGHRSPQGLAFHPETGELWEHEHGPLGGDEINIVRPGANYGWPLVTYGKEYDGKPVSEHVSRPGFEDPFMYWVPSIALSGIAFYTGDRFPAWRGNAFVGSMMQGRIRWTGHIQRLTFSDDGLPIQREPILNELRQRIRDVRQGRDGLLYVLTDEDPGALLRIEPLP